MAFTTPTGPLVRDSDGDRFLDGAECTLGTNPADIASFPLATACGATTERDGDGITTAREICHNHTNPNVANTGGDPCADGKEVASMNAELTVNATDLWQVTEGFRLYTVPPAPHLINFDRTKDGNINASGLSQVTQRFGHC